MKENLEFSGVLTCRQGYTDYNTDAIPLLCYKYPNMQVVSNQPLMATRGRFTK